MRRSSPSACSALPAIDCCSRCAAGCWRDAWQGMSILPSGPTRVPVAVRTAAGALGRWYPVAVVLLAWEALSRSGLVSRRLVPGLADIAQAFAANMASGDIPFHAGISLGRALSGFCLSIAAGVVLGVLMARVRWVETVFEPVFSFGYPVPKIALYPIFIFVFGLGSLSKVALIFLECLYPITLNTYYGMNWVGRIHVWEARNMGATPGQIFWRVLIPSAGPYIFSGFRIALPIAL